MPVAAAYIDLSRHARSLEGLAAWAGTPMKGKKWVNVGRVAKNEQRMINLVRSAALEHPEAFSGAKDVTEGVRLLRRASEAMDEVRRLVGADVAPVVGKQRDTTAAQQPLMDVAHDVRRAHELLGGTRELPALSPVVREALKEAPQAAASDPIVRAKWHKPIQFAAHLLLDSGLRSALGVRTHGSHNIPREGAALIAPNHGGMRDSVYHVTGTHRPVRFIANAKWWNKPVLGKFMQTAGAYPVVHGDAEKGLAIERAVLARGQLATHYAEGMLVHGDFTGPHADGLARMALEMNVPVVVTGTYGSNKPRLLRGERWGRPLVEVVYRKPLDFGGMPATEFNIAIARERIAREQVAAVAEAKELYTARRAASKGRRTYWAGGGAAAGSLYFAESAR